MRFSAPSTVCHFAAIAAALIGLSDGQSFGQTRGSPSATTPPNRDATRPAQNPPAARNTTPATRNTAPATRGATATSSPAAKPYDLAKLARDIANPATHDEAVARAKQLPDSAIVDVWDFLEKSANPDPIKREIFLALGDVYTRARVARKLESTAANNKWKEETGIKAFRRINAKDPLVAQAEAALFASETNAPNGIADMKAVIDKGFKDPLFRYFYITRAMPAGTLDAATGVKQLLDLFADYQKSTYPPGRKFQCGIMLLRYLTNSETASATPPQTKIAVLKDTLSLFPGMVADNPGAETIRDDVKRLWDATKDIERGAAKTRFDKLYPIFSKALPKSATVDFIETAYETEAAWESRGGDVASKVTEQGWKGFRDHLDRAHSAGEYGWRKDPIDPDCATLMITICMGESLDKNTMEIWFTRATGPDPTNIMACRAKMLYLTPKWHGSVEQVLAFGRQCAASGDGNSRLSHVLVEVYGELKSMTDDPAALMATNQAWADMKLAYTKLLADPTLMQTTRAQYLYDRANFVKAAVDCQQWAEADRLIREFGAQVDPQAVGGKARYDYLVKQVGEHLGK